MSEHLDIVRFSARDLGDSIYAPFVLSSFVMSLRRPAFHLWGWLKRPGAFVVVARPVGVDLFVGWLAAIPAENRIIAAFTKAAYRASPEQRHRGHEENADAFRISSTLALTAGIEFSRPVQCSFWSRAAKAIAEKPGNPYSLQFKP